RGLRRQQELAIRLSLGATRGRLIQQGFTEALTLAMCAAALALPVAWAVIRGIVGIAPEGIPRIGSATVDARMFGFALGLALVTTLLFGTLPAVLMARRAPGETLKIGGRTPIAGASRLRGALVIAEFALSLVLLVGAGLLGKSFTAVSEVPLGFQTENVLTMQVSWPNGRYDGNSRARLIDRLVANCSVLPGVSAAAVTSALPLTGEAEGWGVVAEDQPNRENYVAVRVRAITPAYFRALGIRLRAGREFAQRDGRTNPAAILSASAARRIWPGIANPLGRRLVNRSMRLVGIVDDTHASGIDAEVRPYLYVPFSQFAPPDVAVVIRSTADAASLVQAAKREIWRIDPDQPVTHIATMKQVVADAIAPRRFLAVLMGIFAAFALGLAAIGIYGVLSYAVAQRTQEIGIRVALGASPWRVVADILRQGCLLAITGAVLGLLAALPLAPLLRGLLFGVSDTENSIFLGGAAVLVAVAIAASLIPARRAASLDPMTCLRHE
ncbi:MAG TPA: FtsX-like permease family protein, partial [Bryobacteraceae bacterium]|nr:FtsX-like permease family protein [Bryobacteraceae bacterium]